MKNIIVFGADGMLGRYVTTYFNNLDDYYVVEINRKNNDLTEITRDDINNLLSLYNNPIVINCAGAIIQKLNDYGVEKMIEVNSIFPWKLSNVCKQLNIKLIHITTDCVFSGLDGMYDEDAIHSPLDVYGKSKSLGEPDYGTLIRTSIIGEELKGKKSFIEWVKSEKGNTVNGYKRNIWNGISCLQFAKICDKIITDNKFWNGIRHFPSPDFLIKGEMISLVSEIYNLDVKVNLVDLPEQLCNRTVTTKYDISEYKIPTIKDQIIELKNFKLNK